MVAQAWYQRKAQDRALHALPSASGTSGLSKGVRPNANERDPDGPFNLLYIFTQKARATRIPLGHSICLPISLDKKTSD